jgi:hypothetical protein
MTNTSRKEVVLNEFVDDVVAGRMPRVYERMATALDVEVEVLAELIALFDWVRWMHGVFQQARTAGAETSDLAGA